MSVATGQFTVIDYNDALTLTGFIGSNQPKTQMYNPDNASYTPDWTVSPYLVLTPTLYILGNSSDIITSADVTAVTWYSVSAGVETAIVADATHVLSGTKSHILTIKTNELAGLAGKDYVCKVQYTDPTTALVLTYKMGITFSRVVNGGGIADAVAWTPAGNIFKNGSINTLIAQCDLWRGSVIDSTSVTYRWFAQDALVFTPTTLSASAAVSATSVTVTSATGIVVGQSIKIGTANAVNVSAINGTTLTLATGLSSAQASGVTVTHSSYSSDAGAGWRLLSADSANNYTGVATDTLTVYDNFVQNVQVLKCIILDTDTSSNTYNKCFQDTVTFLDQTDSIQISITSTGGDVFKNGVGSTTLTAKVFQAGNEIDAAGTKYTYTWTVFNKDGNASTFSGGAASKTGKSITVGDSDVSVKATFQVTLT